MGPTIGYAQFADTWGQRAKLAWDTIALEPTRGIPAWLVHVMEVPLLERLAGRRPGDYAGDPDGVYIEFKHRAGACLLDQYLAQNPLSMGTHGYEPSTRRGAATGAERIELDGMEIDSPEAVVEHLERFVFPRRARQIAAFDPEDSQAIAAMIEAECAMQRRLGDILKAPYGGGFQDFPRLHYVTYGYASYFMAYALYPEVMERDFAQQADLARLRNARAARAIVDGGLPPLVRLDHDMADSRGTLVSIATLERLWLPHFARAIEPFLEAGVRLIWHCDGNLMELIPRLLEAGVGGFQGFQYEDGMDYPRICRMKTRDGGPLLIVAGASSSRTLPLGARQEVIDQLKWLVDNGPDQGLFLGASSSIVPGTPPENILALLEGLEYYRRCP